MSFNEASEYDRGWAVGILEGEGCFTTCGSKTKLYPRIKVAMVDLDVMERLAGILGTKVTGPYANGPRATQPIYHLVVPRAQTNELMRTLRPLMGERRQQRIGELV